MHIRAFGFLVLLVVGPVGCVGSHPPEERELEGAASYQLTVAPIEADSLLTSGVEAELRLDLAIADGVITARVSPAWGGTYRYRADVSDPVLVPVDGRAGFEASSLEGWPARIGLEEIAVDALLQGGELGESGELAIVVSIDHPFGEGPSTATGRAIAGPDDVAPQARFARLERIGALQPWEVVGFALSEPIARADLESRLSANVEIVADYVETDDGLVTYAEIRPVGWWDPDQVEIGLAAGYTDPSGNGGAEVSETFARRIDPSPEAGYTFDVGDGATVWTEGTRSQPLPEEVACEGCLVLQRVPMGYAGLYSELSSAEPFTTIDVRFRVLGELAPDSFADFHQTQVIGSAAELGSSEVVETSQSFGVDVAPESLPDGFISDSGFIEISLVLPAPSTHAGFSLDITDGYGWYDTGITSAAGGASPPPPQAMATVLVDSITVR